MKYRIEQGKEKQREKRRKEVADDIARQKKKKEALESMNPIQKVKDWHAKEMGATSR